MLQRINSLLSPPSLHRFFKKTNLLTSGLAVAALLFLVSLQAAPGDAPDFTRHLTAKLPPTSDTTITATICANGFYVFNGDTVTEAGDYLATFEDTNGLDSTVTLNLVVLPLRSGSESATICEGTSYDFHGELLAQAGTYETALPAFNGCDSIVTLTLSVKPKSLTQIEAGICSGSAYIFQGTTLTESGNYSVVMPAFNGCDSVVELTLHVVDSFNTPLNATICAGEGYIFNGDTLQVAGTYTDTLTAAGGCDSVLTLQLKVLPVALTNLVVGICTGSNYIFQGETLDATGVYTDTLTAFNGCDSIVVLKLTVADFFDIQQTITLCAGATYVFGTETLDTEGTYVQELSAAGGCDSTVTLALTVLPVLTGTAEATICAGDTLAYNGALLTEADVYQFVLTAANGCDSTVTFTLNVKPTADSTLQASICAGSSYAFNGDTLEQTGVYTQVLEAFNGCDSTVTLNLKVLPLSHTDITASICANEVYVFDGDTLDQAGVYTAKLTGLNGCDSTVVLTLNVLPVQSAAVAATSCAGTNYVFNGTSLTASGTYTAILSGLNGCDSTVVLTLTVLPTHDSTITATTCANEPYVSNGQSYTASGTYLQVLEGANGCDSTLTIILTVLPIAETTIAATVCAGETYGYEGDTLTASGNYTYIYTAFNGCDSVVTVRLTVRPLLSTQLTVSLCAGGSYIFDGDTLTTSGTFMATYAGTTGCDSTVTLDLSIVPFFETAVGSSICNGETYAFGGTLLNTAGMYVDSLTSNGGCDSIVILTLTIKPVAESTTTATICAGENYAFNGQLYTESGQYNALLTSVNGCDSTATLLLTVLPVTTTNLEATICAAESYSFNGTTLSASGTYTSTLIGANGCDSLLVLSLTVLPAQGSTLTAAVCNGNSYTYAGDTLTNAGTYTYTLSAVTGCDSLVSLVLTVLPSIPVTTTSATICAGTAFDFNGELLTEAGSYAADLSSASGCDSTVLLVLTVLPKVTTTLNATICAGESYSYLGQDLTTAGIYSAVFTAANGCDSTVLLILAVNVANTTVALQNGTLTAQAPGAVYQWIDCATNNPIAGATGSSYTPTVTGSYAVFISQNGCTGISACQLVQVSGTHEALSASRWSVQPNPAHDQTSVLLQGDFAGNTRIEIYDASGRLLQKQNVASGAEQVDLDLTGLPDGLLLVRLVNEQAASTKRLVKAGN